MSRRNRRRAGTRFNVNRKTFAIERLEDRRLLAFDFADNVFVPDSPEEQAIADEVGTDLAWLYSDFVDWEAAGGAEEEPFATFSPAFQQVGFAVDDLNVSIEAYAETDAAAIRDDMNSLGFQELASYGRGLTGWLPIASIDDVAATAGLLFARITHGSMTNVGNTDTQGDAAQRSNDVRTMLGFDGTGVTVGVISDSYDVSASAGGSAAQDVTSSDLPAGVNVLDDTRNPNQVIDEGRAMLQIVHDVAPGAGLAFHTAGVSQIAMASAIDDLRTAGSDVIVDDIIFFAEPMFQDGVIAQAANTADANGVPYFSAAGNQARRSYENVFNPGAPVLIGGVAETPHEFDPGTNDILQNVTVPIGGLFRLSFQWDAPSASAGGVGANSDLNIYLISGGSTIVAQGRVNNIGGDAVEVPVFFNNTGTTQFDILITSAGGPLPGTIKYVDFGIGTTFNEYLTNSSTLFGHANAAGAIAVGAASFLDTPQFGTNPPVIENFSALGGTPILFDTAGTALVAPEIRQKVEIVGPDGGNTTFFGTDIAGDADAFPNFFGTSAAAPHVAALAALMLDINPTLTTDDISSVLGNTAIDMDDPVAAGFQTGFDFATGLGLIDGLVAAQAVPAASGDYNRDGSVDAADYSVWRDNLGATVADYAGADGDGDGMIDSDDFQVWRSHYGSTVAILPAPVAAAVAESGTVEDNDFLAALALATAEPVREQPTVPATPQLSTAANDLALLLLLTEPPQVGDYSSELGLEIPGDGSSEADDFVATLELAFDEVFSGV